MKAMLSLPFQGLGIHVPVNPFLILTVLALLVAAWGVFTLILRYHWKHYSTRKTEVFVMSFFYFSGSAILIGLMFLSAFFYYNTALAVG